MNSKPVFNNINQEESYETLLRRTKELSIPVSKIGDNVEKTYYLNFQIQNTGYAIFIKYIRGVVSSFNLTGIPDIPDFISGIADYRGKIIAIFDFHKFLNYSTTKIKSDSKLILVSHNNIECGILVDKVYNVLSFPVSSVEKNISTVDENTSKYLKGMIRVDRTLYALIDIPKIFESEKVQKLKGLSEE